MSFSIGPYIQMATPNSATLFWRNYSRKRSTGSSKGAGTPFGPSLLKLPVFLHEWWLIQADTGSHGRGLGVGGFTVLKRQGERMFFSAPIVKRHDSVTLETADGIKVLVAGLPNKSMTLKNGFSHRVCNHFAIGFPYDWEEYASLSFLEDENSTHDSEHRESAEDIWNNILALVRKDGQSLESRSKTFSVSPAEESPKLEGKAFALNVKGQRSPPTPAYRSPVKPSTAIKSDLKRKGAELKGPLTRSKAKKLDN